MKKTIHRANSRGAANHGWLRSHHSFSFANYYNPERMGFGLLRVLNDDEIDASQGFGTHPHENMEIVSVPISGALEHKDSEGNHAVIREGEVQAMSAGTGIFHSEYNHSSSEVAQFLQIWVLPKEKDISPRYDQKVFEVAERKNNFQTVVSPLGSEDGGVKINQDAYFSLSDLDSGEKLSYELKNPENGIYTFLLEGELSVAGETLKRRDALGVEDVSSVDFEAKSDSKILVIEVPMK